MFCKKVICSMDFNNVNVIGKGLSPLCYLPSGRLVCYRYGHVLIFEDSRIVKTLYVFNSKKECILGRCRYLYRLLRMGVRAALALDENVVLLSVGNKILELDLEDGTLSDGYFCGEGIRPLIFTQVVGVSSIDSGIYFGGYLGNRTKAPVFVYKRTGKDKWEVVYVFPQGTINHVHTIVSDSFRDCLWIFTGDFDEASAIWKVTDNFQRVECVCSNDQKYRGCVVFALPEGLLYATDAPFAEDYIYLMNPVNFSVKTIAPISGSCIYGCQWKDKYVFSSTVEGDGRNTSRLEFYFGRKRGGGIKDEYVHMFCGNLDEGFKEIYKEKKDCMPYYTFQFGVFKFPYGTNNTDKLYFQPVATKANDLKLVEINEMNICIEK